MISDKAVDPLTVDQKLELFRARNPRLKQPPSNPSNLYAVKGDSTTSPHQHASHPQPAKQHTCEEKTPHTTTNSDQKPNRTQKATQPQTKNYAIANPHTHAKNPSDKTEANNLKKPKQTTAPTAKKN